MDSIVHTLRISELLDLICNYLNPKDIINLHTVLKSRMSYHNFCRIMGYVQYTVNVLQFEINEQTTQCFSCHEEGSYQDFVTCLCYYCINKSDENRIYPRDWDGRDGIVLHVLIKNVEVDAES